MHSGSVLVSFCCQGFHSESKPNIFLQVFIFLAYFLFIVGYPTIHYSAMLRYVPWAIWFGKCRYHEKLIRQFHWFSFRKPLRKTSQWNYILYLRFGLPFKTCVFISFLSKKIPVWRHCYWRVFNCNMQFYWKKIGLTCIFIKTIFCQSNCPRYIIMECNRKKYCGCQRWFLL